MKKTILLGTIVMFAMASCKKDRTCECKSTTTSETVNGVSQPITDPVTTTTTKYTKASKGSVECNSGEQTVNFNYTVNNTTYALAQTNKVECTLK